MLHHHHMRNARLVIAHIDGFAFHRDVGDGSGDDEVDFPFRVSQLEIVAGLIIRVACPDALASQPGRQHRDVLRVVDERVDVFAQPVPRVDHEGSTASENPVGNWLSARSETLETCDRSIEQKSPLGQVRPPNPGSAHPSWSSWPNTPRRAWTWRSRERWQNPKPSSAIHP
jgi:hypothetical protein